MATISYSSLAEANARSAEWWLAILGRSKSAEDVTEYAYGRSGTAIVINARDTYLDALLDAAQMTTAEQDALIDIYPEWFDGLENAATALVTPTYDGSGQAVHPDVVYFDTPWNGYQYWMAITPYANTDDALENASILVSHDGVTWVVPPGLTNPIDPKPATGHGADTDMIYDEASDQLWCYYIETGAGTLYIKRRTSSDGITWSAEADIFNLPDYQALSPAVQKVGDTYHLWYVNAGASGCSASSTTVVHRTSSDGVTWGAAENTTITQTGRTIWHVDVVYVPSKSEYWMLFPAYPSGGNCANTALYFAKSADGVTWTTYTHRALSKSDSGFDSTQIYRSTLLYDSANDLLRVWYSSRGGGAWHAGYTERDYSEFLADIT